MNACGIIFGTGRHLHKYLEKRNYENDDTGRTRTKLVVVVVVVEEKNFKNVVQ